MNTYYDILEISSSATQAEIKIAYYKLALKYHPDRNLNKESGDSKMKEINFIYSILSNPEKRKWYDSTITFSEDDEKQKEHSYTLIFCDEIEVTDSKGAKTKLHVGDTIYYLVEIDKSIITWKYKSREYFSLIIKNIFDPGKRDLFVYAIKYDLNKTPLCTAHWGNSEMIIYKEDFENHWISQKSYSKFDNRKGIVSGIIIIIFILLGIYYFYTRFSFSADFYFKKGKAEYEEKLDSKNALIHLSKAIELNPTYIQAYFERGLIKFDINDYEGSIQDLNKAIDIKPSDSVFVFRAMAKYYAGDFTGVIFDCEKAIALKPSKDILLEAYNYMGRAKLNLENYDDALKDYNKAIELDPSYAWTYLNRGSVEIKLNLQKEACSDFHKAKDLGDEGADNLIKKYCKK